MILSDLTALTNPQKAAEMAAYHKIDRPYLGVPNPVLHAMARTARKQLSTEQLIENATTLWASDIHEARVLAASLLTAARFRPDDAEVWETLQGFVADFDAWAISDHVSGAIAKRLTAQPARLDTVEGWMDAKSLWTRRAALVCTLPWARLKDPSADEIQARMRILGWAVRMLADKDWFAHKCVAWWLRELSRKDPGLANDFLHAHGTKMKAFARKEAAKYLP